MNRDAWRTNMLEGKTVDELRAIVLAGGGLEINGGHYSTDDLRAIVLAGHRAPQIVIHNSKSKSTEDLRAIALAGGGKIIFA
jgi:hypothetical protein